MSTETTITFVCDRCGSKVPRTADTRIAEEKLPEGWFYLQSNSHPGRRTEVCADCHLEWEEWLERAPKGSWPPDARRFARWFLSQPYEIRQRFIREQEKRS